ncbi:MAG: hypothetical protein HQ523_11995 [Lentisphaerae bacterium]|nr:hypothetical protein [Lentisphaerota bacterium]
MARKTHNGYTRLAKGRRASGLVVATRQSLWLGEDHLLVVNNHGYTEDYKRFYFAQVQGVVLHQTPGGTLRMGLLLFVLLGSTLTLLPGLIFGWPATMNWVTGSLTGICAALLLIGQVKGPTCSCTIHTAVQSHRLHALHRLRHAVPALQQLRECIELVQGPLDPAQLTQIMMDGTPPLAGSRTRTAERGRKPQLRAIKTTTHAAVFVLLLGDCIHSAIRITQSGIALLAIGMLTGTALTVLTVLALVRQQNSTLPLSVRRTTWFAAGHLGICQAIGMVYAIICAISHPETSGDSWNRMKAMAAIQALESPGLMAILIYAIIASLVIGATGLRLLERHRIAASAPPPLQPPL